MTRQDHILLDISTLLKKYEKFMNSIPTEFISYDDEIAQIIQEIAQLCDDEIHLRKKYVDYTKCEYFIK